MKTDGDWSWKPNSTVNELYKYFLCFFLGLKISSTVRIFRNELQRLLTDSRGKFSAIDLKQRYQEVQAWFSGEPVYGQIHTAVYPPASYLQLSGFLNYPSFTVVRWIWAITTIFCLAALIYLLIKHSLVKNNLERICIAFVVVSMYSTGETIGNGQLTIHILAALTGGITLLHQCQGCWKKELLSSFLLVFALIKPTLAFPFLWIVLLVSSSLRPILMIVIGYGAIATIATWFQEGNLFSLHWQWLQQGMAGSSWGSSGGGGDVTTNTIGSISGYGNVHNWLGALGLSEWNLVATLAMLLLLGVWVYFYRSVDIWILLGVTALVTRLCTYHLVYDDLLVIFPMIALIRALKNHSILMSQKLISAGLLFITVFASILRSTLRIQPFPIGVLFKVGQTSIWVMLLVFLVYLAWCLKKESLAIKKSLMLG